MLGINWLIRMSQWARNPPSPQRVKLVVGVILLCFLLWGAELLWGWPAWLTVNNRP